MTTKRPKTWQKHQKFAKNTPKTPFRHPPIFACSPESIVMYLHYFHANSGQFGAKKSEIAISGTLILNAMLQKPTNPSLTNSTKAKLGPKTD